MSNNINARCVVTGLGMVNAIGKNVEEMFDVQVEANKEAKEELKRSRQFNIAMMIIAIVAMLAAIAGPIATIWGSI